MTKKKETTTTGKARSVNPQTFKKGALRQVRDLLRQCGEYEEMGRDFPTGGVGNLGEQLRELRSALERPLKPCPEVPGPATPMDEELRSGDAIAIIWTTGDVMCEDHRLTAEQARDILYTIENNHDASLGVTNDTIADAVREFCASNGMDEPQPDEDDEDGDEEDDQ